MLVTFALLGPGEEAASTAETRIIAHRQRSADPGRPPRTAPVSGVDAGAIPRRRRQRRRSPRNRGPVRAGNHPSDLGRCSAGQGPGLGCREQCGANGNDTSHSERRRHSVSREQCGCPHADLDDPRPGTKSKAGRHLGVRLILTLVVLLPMLATAILIMSSANSAWKFAPERRRWWPTTPLALQVVASARAQMNSLEVPLSAVSYAAQFGISEPVLDSLLHPAVPFKHPAGPGHGHHRRLPHFLVHADASGRRGRRCRP